MSHRLPKPTPPTGPRLSPEENERRAAALIGVLRALRARNAAARQHTA